MSQTNRESDESEQFLTFTCADVDYAVPISRIKEIIPYVRSTRVPLAPATIRGLINLRGHAIPLLDLAVRFGGEPIRSTRRTCVLIVELDGREDQSEIGILTDSVTRVVDVATEDVEQTPRFGMGAASDYLNGVLNLDAGFVAILDVDRVLAPDELLPTLSSEALGSAIAASDGVGTQERAEAEAEEPPA